MNVIKSVFVILLLAIGISSYAQTGELRGTVSVDEVPVADAMIRVYNGEQFITGASTDSLGLFGLKQLPVGNYQVEVSYTPFVKKFPVTIGQDQVTVKQFKLGGGQIVDEHVVRGVPTEPRIVIKDSLIEMAPTQGALKLFTQTAGVTPIGNGGMSIVGSRPNANLAFINGQAQLPGSPIFKMGFDVQSAGVQATSIPARYGGFTGGGLTFNTVMPSIRRQLRFDVTSSTLTSPYAQNRVHAFLSAPLLVEKFTLPDSDKEEKRMILGYTLATYLTYNKDNRPLYGGVDVVNQETLDEYFNSPLTSSEKVGGYVHASNFINENNIDHKKAQDNASLADATARFKLAYTPRDRTALVLDARGSYGQRQLVSIGNMILNSAHNPLRISSSYNVGLDFSQTIKAPYDAMGRATFDTTDWFSHVFYTIKTSYQSNYSKTMDPVHRDNIFDYGNIGRFTTYREPVYEYKDGQARTVTDQYGNEVNIRGFHELTGFRDTAVTSTASGKNEELSRLNEQIMDLLGSSINNTTEFGESEGVLNGYNPSGLYAMYNNPGSIVTNYRKTQYERFSILAMGEAAFHPMRNSSVQHDLQFGLQFEQFNQSYYSVAAQRLWQLMPLLANNHLSELDLQNPILSYDEQGRFTDTVSYERRVLLDDQKHFDKALRDKLIAQGAIDVYGNRIDQQSQIDINSLNPEVFELSMFSADELLNNGNAYVGYSGYDHLGNRRRGKTSLTDFLNDPANRPMDSYSPNYTALFLQDKFVYGDMTMRLGLRLERFDANQAVLKDPYSFFPIRSAGEVSSVGGIEVDHPSIVGEDYAVYVNNMDNPTKIVGYRNGSEWFDHNGIRVTDPTELARRTSNGQIQPYLVDPQNQTISKGSFASYEPVISLLPRVYFSFPLKEAHAVFYASYDKLAQRAPDAQSYVPLSTYYNIQSFTNSVIPNANMKPRIKTAYEIGFRQLIGKRAQLELKTSYSTIRNDFNQVRMEQAYPFSYTTYSNIDFSTVKMYSIDYRYIGKAMNLSASYTLQFADGTGSNVNSAATLLQSGQPNLRSLYPLSFDVRHSLKGSVIFNLSKSNMSRLPYLGRAFKSAHLAVNLRSLSGTPYSAIANPIPAVQSVATRTQIKGQPFGSRMPWQHNVDLKYEKNFVTSYDTINRRLRARNSVSVYVLVNNILNTQQVFGVYSYTGSATDDGYLNSPQGIKNAESQLSAETFTQLYKMRMDNPYNMAQPRQVKIGVKFNFM